MEVSADIAAHRRRITLGYIVFLNWIIIRMEPTGVCGSFEILDFFLNRTYFDNWKYRALSAFLCSVRKNPHHIIHFHYIVTPFSLGVPLSTIVQ